MTRNWKKDAAIFITSQAISVFGSSLVQFAISWYITLTTKSGVYATISIICGFLPTFLLSPFAGVWADRYNRKTLIMLADGFIALSTLILAVFFISGHDYLWLLFVVSVIRGLGSAVQNPCVSAMLPDIVPEDQLTRVNGLNSSITSVLFLVSPMLSGVFMGVLSMGYIFLIDVVTAAIAIAVLLLFLHIPAREKKDAHTENNYFTELKQGFSYIAGQKYLVGFFIFMSVFCIMIAPAAFLTPLQVTRVFGDDVWRLTAIEMAFSIGMALGGLLVAAWGGLKNRTHTMFLSNLVAAVCTVMLGLAGSFWTYNLFMAVMGLAIPFFNTAGIVIMQEKVDPDYLGRIFGVVTMINSSMMPIGMLVFGPLADLFPIENLMIISGCLMFGAGFFLLFNKAVLQAGERPVK